MKQLALITILTLFMGMGSWVLADTAVATPDPHPGIAEVHTRVHDQMARIKAGVKNGTLSRDQAKALMGTLRAVHEQIKADFATNGTRELTEDQAKQLNQLLDENSKTIYGEKHDGSSDSTTGSNTTGSASTGNATPGSN